MSTRLPQGIQRISRLCLRLENYANDSLQDNGQEEPPRPPPLENFNGALSEDRHATGRSRSHWRDEVVDVLRL